MKRTPTRASFSPVDAVRIGSVVVARHRLEEFIRAFSTQWAEFREALEIVEVDTQTSDSCVWVRYTRAGNACGECEEIAFETDTPEPEVCPHEWLEFFNIEPAEMYQHILD